MASRKHLALEFPDSLLASSANIGSRVVPSNNPRAIEILLHIIHLNTRQIPRAADISVEELFQIAVAVDMYDLCGCLGLWAKGWCSAVSRIVKTTTEVEVLEQLGWIAWVFGDGRMFEHVLEQLVVEVEVDGEGGLVDAQGVGLGDNFLRAMDLLGECSTRLPCINGSVNAGRALRDQIC